MCITTKQQAAFSGDQTRVDLTVGLIPPENASGLAIHCGDPAAGPLKLGGGAPILHYGTACVGPESWILDVKAAMITHAHEKCSEARVIGGAIEQRTSLQAWANELPAAIEGLVVTKNGCRRRAKHQLMGGPVDAVHA